MTNKKTDNSEPHLATATLTITSSLTPSDDDSPKVSIDWDPPIEALAGLEDKDVPRSHRAMSIVFANGIAPMIKGSSLERELNPEPTLRSVN